MCQPAHPNDEHLYWKGFELSMTLEPVIVPILFPADFTAPLQSLDLILSVRYLGVEIMRGVVVVKVQM